MKQRDMGIGIGLVALGLIFLIGPWLNLEAFGWPFFVIIPGAILLLLAFTSRVGNGGLAVPGSIVTVTGLILLVLNITGHMEAWAYAWTLVMAAAGLGTYLYGVISDSESLRRTGSRGAVLGLVLFAIFGLVFELFIFGSFGSVLRWLIPVALIAVGGLLLYNGTRTKTSAQRAAQATRAPQVPPVNPATTPPPNAPAQRTTAAPRPVSPTDPMADDKDVR